MTTIPILILQEQRNNTEDRTIREELDEAIGLLSRIEHVKLQAKIETCQELEEVFNSVIENTIYESTHIEVMRRMVQRLRQLKETKT